MKYFSCSFFVFDSNWRIDYILIIVYSFQCLHRRFIKLCSPMDRICKPKFNFTFEDYAIVDWNEKRLVISTAICGQWLVWTKHFNHLAGEGGWVFVWWGDETTLFQHHHKHSKLTIHKSRIFENKNPMSWPTSLLDTMRKWENSI